MLKGIRLVIYDLDGTLIDSREAICSTFKTVLADIGESERPSPYMEAITGLPLTKMFLAALPRDKHARVKWCWERYIEIYGVLAPKITHVIPGVKEILAYFNSLRLKQTVSTTKRSKVARRLLDYLGLLSSFDFVLGISDVDAPKPEPE